MTKRHYLVTIEGDISLPAWARNIEVELRELGQRQEGHDAICPAHGIVRGVKGALGGGPFCAECGLPSVPLTKRLRSKSLLHEVAMLMLQGEP